MEQVGRESVMVERHSMFALGIFASFAILLAAIGLYGVMSYAVTNRTSEIGIRVALGARPFDVLKLVISQGMVLALIGVAIGLIASLGLVHLLFKLSTTAPWTFSACALLLTIVALLACWIPARRATQVDPMVALRNE